MGQNTHQRGGKHPSLFRSPPPAPAIDSQQSSLLRQRRSVLQGARGSPRAPPHPNSGGLHVHSSFRDGDRHRHRSLPWPAHGPRHEPPGGIDQSVHHTFAPSASSTGAASSPARGPGGRRLRPESVLERGTDRVGPQQRGRLDDGDGRPDAEEGLVAVPEERRLVVEGQARLRKGARARGGSGRSRW